MKNCWQNWNSINVQPFCLFSSTWVNPDVIEQNTIPIGIYYILNSMLRRSQFVFHRLHSAVRGLSTQTKITATGVDVVSPILGVSDDQKEFYKLARNFADNEMKPFAGKYLIVYIHNCSVFYSSSHCSKMG